MSDGKIPALLTAFNVFNATHGRPAEDRLATFLSSLAASGYAIVPLEATDAMVLAALDRNQQEDEVMHSSIWRAMLAAAQKEPG